MEDEQNYRQLDEEAEREIRKAENTKVPYYWLLAVHSPSGRHIYMGPYDTEDEANKVGFEKIGDSFEVLPLKTRDPNRATKILKYKRFHRTAKLEEALKRAKHKTEKDGA